MGRADIDIKFGANLDGLRTGMQKVQNQISDFQKSIGNAAAAVGVAFGAAQLGAFANDAAGLAAKAEGVANAFEKLNQPGLLKQLRSATKGTTDDLTLMQSAVRAKNLGISIQQLATYFEFAHRRARETGESVDFLVEKIILGIGRNSVLHLDDLGLATSRIKAEMEQTGDMASAVGNIIQEEFEKAGDYVETSADAMDRQRAAMANLRIEVGQKLIPTLLKLYTLFGKMAGAANIALSDNLSFMEKVDLTVTRIIDSLPGGASESAKHHGKVLANKMNGGVNYFPSGVRENVPMNELLFPSGGVGLGGSNSLAGSTTGLQENLRGANETLVQMAQKSLPGLTAGLQTLNSIQGQTLPMFDENLLRIHETYAKLQGVSDLFMQGLQQSFEAALINGEEFFFVLGEWLSNFLKQMAAAVASALALAAVMSLIAPGVGTFGGNFMNLLGGSGGNVGNLVGVLRGDDIFLSNQRNGYGRSRTGN
jgi:hypothetical protein